MPTYIITAETSYIESSDGSRILLHVTGADIEIERAVIEKWSREIAKERLSELVGSKESEEKNCKN